jgi:signal transduction histidine kinase
MMDVPLVQGDEVIGVICHEAVGPARPWSAADCAYAETVARMLSQALAQLSPSGHAKAIVESAERLSRTAAGVAHDFLNLLTIVQGNTELIRLSLPPDLDPNLSQRLQTILEVVDRGTELAKDLGICARRQLAVPRVLSISKKVQEFLPVLHLLLKGQHSLQFENHSRGGLVFMDPVSIERIVLNLVKNAQEASAPGTTIIVRIDDDIAVDPEEPLRRFKRLTVQDQGRGIPADQLSSIFTPYTTSKFASATSGLGLTVVQELTERFGGFVRVESEVGVGSRFLVFIPRISAGRPYVHPICAEPALG